MTWSCCSPRLSPFEAGIAQLRGTPLPATCLPGAGATLTRCNQLGAFGLNQEIRGWTEKDVWQAQFTATKTFANILRASQMVVVFEGGVTHIPGSRGRVHRAARRAAACATTRPGTSVSGNPELASRHFGEVEPAGRFADATSWGYRIAGRFEYPNAIGAWNLMPRFSWQQDVKGTTPGPGGNFIEDRYGLTLGIAANLRAHLGARCGLDASSAAPAASTISTTATSSRPASSIRSDPVRREASHAQKNSRVCRRRRCSPRRGMGCGQRSRKRRSSARSSRRWARRRPAMRDGTHSGVDRRHQVRRRGRLSRTTGPASITRTRTRATSRSSRSRPRTWGSTRASSPRGTRSCCRRTRALQDGRVSHASQRRVPAAHLRCDQAHRHDREAHRRRQRRDRRDRRHAVPDSRRRASRCSGITCCAIARTPERAPSARRRSPRAAPTRW